VKPKAVKLKRIVALLLIGVAGCLLLFAVSSYVVGYHLYGTLPFLHPPKNLAIAVERGGMAISLEAHRPQSWFRPSPFRVRFERAMNYPRVRDTNCISVDCLGLEVSSGDWAGTNNQRRYNLVFPFVAIPVLLMFLLGVASLRSRRRERPGFEVSGPRA
jgi:hypothetical protein